MKIGEAPLTGFKWLLNIDISPDFFQRILVEGLGSKLSTLEILSHGSNLPARKLPEDRLPCLRKLLVRGVYSPQRVAELHYILRASPGLQSFGFGVGEAAIPEADLNSRFRFSDSEMVGIGLENHDFGWERAPTNWTDFIETCIFKNLQRLPLRELVIEDVGLTPMMAKLLPLGSLRHMSLSGIGTSFGFIETIDTQKLRLETCNIVYERVGENCLFRKFIGDLQPGLRHLGFRCKAWDVDIDLDELGHTLEVEYPGIFLLPEGFTEKQKDTLETLIFNVTIPDWKGGWVTPPKNFEISSEFSKLTEASIPLLMRNTMSKKRLPNGPIPGPQKIFWTLIPIPLSGASGLPNLRTLTLTPISTEYRADFVENIFETGIHFKGWVEMYQEQLVKYVEDLVGTYATGYMQVFGIDRRPSLEWIFVIGEESCHFEVGFRIEWSLVNGESKYDSRITLLPGTDARNSIKTEDMRFRTAQIPLSPQFVEHRRSGITLNSTIGSEPLRYLIHSFETLQSVFFSPERGDYPSAIDWTAAVVQTHAVSALHSILLSPLPKNETLNIIDIYFPDIISFYHTQNVGSLKFQAYDDMLWVVLGWLAGVRFLDAYYYLFPESYNPDFYTYRMDFALRAREFWVYAEKGWDELFCDGGMIWNPNLQPYKNAITNELFISASIQMYTTFPPEFNPPESWFFFGGGGDGGNDKRKGQKRDVAYLEYAVKAYDWFKGSNFTNDAGLVTDGFHMSSYWKRKCDERDEQTYTYNQGVVLSGLRALWEETRDKVYLEDGYQLIESVIESAGKVGEMVRADVLEDHCDSWGWCNQDQQAFKGIFFHHLTAFCSPHPYTKTWKSKDEKHSPELNTHVERCKTFFPFIGRNSIAAWTTRHRNSSVFGMWWSAPLFEKDPGFTDKLQSGDLEMKRDPKAVDLFNTDRGGDWEIGATEAEVQLARSGKVVWGKEPKNGKPITQMNRMEGDLNDRFLGRTVETQTGGIGVMRAAWEIGSLFL
ncbi:hypothetical protein TWF191_010392 [Orbilia oligospora]|uniref:Uncharacterized protein n=1 Tax=Orbilia oligospora TaxID=2813651 RepID=A0A7C8QH61_ORBOL|nr:hypothetical protein TWF191_010392 [Orbilia oligospora]